MKNKNTSLAVVSTPIQPKPTKTEIIEAAVQARVEELQKEKKAYIEEYEKIKSAFNKKLWSLIKKIKIEDIKKMDWSCWHQSVEIQFKCLPDDLAAEEKKLDEATKRASMRIDAAKIKEEVRNRINNGGSTSKDRINALLNHTETRKALLELSERK